MNLWTIFFSSFASFRVFRGQTHAGFEGISIADPFADIPAELRWTQPLRLPSALSESELSARLLDLAAPNTHLDEAVCFLGGGAADHYVPAVVDAIAAQAGSAAVGPAAPEALLRTVFELQALFASLTALDAATAPFADGPTAFAEAIRLAARATGRTEVVLARSASPPYRAIAQTRLACPPGQASGTGGEGRGAGDEGPGVTGLPVGRRQAAVSSEDSAKGVSLCRLPPASCRLASGSGLSFREAGYHGGVLRHDEAERLLSDQTACLVVEQPNFFGCLEDLPTLAAAAHRHGALLVVRVDPISLGLLAPPGQVGADIAVADAQPLGSRPAYGGSIGLLAARGALAARLPGWRVEREGDAFVGVGEAPEARGEGEAPAEPRWPRVGRLGRSLALPPRQEGLVRAEQVVRPVAYLAALGAQGLREAAALCAQAAHETQRRICAIEGFSPRFRAPFFKEFVVESDRDPEEVAEALLESNILGALPLQGLYPEMEGCLLFAATERRTRADIDLLCHALSLLAGGDWEREGGPSEEGSEDEDLI